MSLEDDLQAVRDQIDGNVKYGDTTPWERLGEADDERAVDLLLEGFEWAIYRTGEPAKTALMASPNADVSPKIGERLSRWWEDDATLCVAHGAGILAARGDDRVMDELVRMSEVAKDDAIVLRGLLIARASLGDASANEAIRGRFLGGNDLHGDDSYPEKMLPLLSPAAFYDCFAEVFTRYQAGEDALGRKVSKLAFVLTTPKTKYEGGTRVSLPMPERDPRWFELGVEILAERPRPQLSAYAPKLLDVEHPEREARLRDIGWPEPPKPDPIFTKLPEQFEALRKNGDWSLRRGVGGWYLYTRTLKIAQLDELLEALGDTLDEIPGLSIAGRPLKPAAFTKLFGWEGLARFTHLDVSSTPMKLPDVRKLLRSRHAAQLEHLDLTGLRLKKPPFAELRKLEKLRSLRALSTWENIHWGDAELAAIVKSGLPFERLDLPSWRLGSELELYGVNESARALRTILLTNQWSLGPAAPRFLQGLAENEGQLERLDVSGCFANVGPGDWNLADDAPMPSFRVLQARGTKVRDFVAQLVDAWFFGQLEDLDLAHVGFHEALLTAKAPLKKLSLRGAHGLDGAALEKLGQAPIAEHLEWLDVGGATDLRVDDIERVPEHVQEAMRAADWPFA